MNEERANWTRIEWPALYTWPVEHIIDICGGEMPMLLTQVIVVEGVEIRLHFMQDDFVGERVYTHAMWNHEKETGNK